MTRYREQAFKAVWMSNFEDVVLKLAPELAGRINWPEVQHYYFTGVTFTEAARRYVTTFGAHHEH